MKLVNLTPHAITIRLPDGTDRTIEPSGMVARVIAVQGCRIDDVDGIPCYGASGAGVVEGLPEQQEGTVYIVSSLVASSLSSLYREDVYSPGTGPQDGAIRNENGQIVAVTRLIRAC